MVKIKTFTSQLNIFHMMKELNTIDNEVNSFISSNAIKKVISASDAVTTGSKGETIGIIRVLTYED